MSDNFKSKWGRLPKRLQVTYLLIIIVVAIGVSTFLTMWGIGQIKPLAAPNQASLSVSSGDQNYEVGTVFSLLIYLGADRQDQIKKIQLNSFEYDPAMVIVDNGGGPLKANPSLLTNLHSTVNTVEVDGAGQQTGKIDLIMENSGTDYYTGGSTRLATINFRVLKAGQATFSFDPPDGTGNGALVNNATDANILFSAPAGTIALGAVAEEPTPTSSVTSAPTSSTQADQPTQSDSSSSSKNTSKKAVSKPGTITSKVSPTPAATPQDNSLASTDSVKVKGSFSKVTILIYVGIAAAVTLIALLIWFIQNKKRGSAGKSKEDDDELI